MASEDTRLLIQTGIGLLGAVLGGKRKKVNNVLAGLNDALVIYDGLAALDKRIAVAATSGHGVNLTAEETASLYAMLTRLKTLHRI